MKIRIQKLGPLEDVALPLRPFTAILGPNHAGKTWLAYAVYAVHATRFRRYIASPGNAALEGGWEAIKEEFRRELAWRTDGAIRSLPIFFQDKSVRTKEATVELDVEDDEIRAILQRAGGEFRADGRFLPKQGKRAKQAPKRWQPVKLRELLVQTVRSFIDIPFALPAERNSLILTYKMLAQRRLKLLIDARRMAFPFDGGIDARLSTEEELYRERGELRFPQPVEDFLEFLSNCEIDERERPKEPISALAAQLEAAAMGEHRLVWEKAGLAGRELKLSIPGFEALDLYNASSAVKQLAPLLLWMRHGRPGGLLIIDEPELNLHPHTQAKLLETLAILVRLGKKVLLTTHSPYIIAHLNNLVAGTPGDSPLSQRQAKHLLMKDARAFLRKDEVGAWQMEGGKLTDLWEEGWGIRSRTLGDASNELQDIYFAIQGEVENDAGK